MGTITATGIAIGSDELSSVNQRIYIYIYKHWSSLLSSGTQLYRRDRIWLTIPKPPLLRSVLNILAQIQCIAMNQAFSLPGHPFKLGWDYICMQVSMYTSFSLLPILRVFYCSSFLLCNYRRSEKLEEAKKEVAAAEALVELASGSRG